MLEHVTYDGNVTAEDVTNYSLPPRSGPPRGIPTTWSRRRRIPISAKDAGESPTVGSPTAIVNAVVDAMEHYGARHVDRPMTPDRVWSVLDEAGLPRNPETLNRTGSQAFPMTCHSGGTLELFAEPVTPTPRLVVVGGSPLSNARQTSGRSDLRRPVRRRRRRRSPRRGAPPRGRGRRRRITRRCRRGRARRDHGRADVPYVGLVVSGARAAELIERVAGRTGRGPETVVDPGRLLAVTEGAT